jgi:hypothetical protein
MTDKANFPAISRHVTELVLAGSIDHAEEAFDETVEKFGDLAVVEVLDAMSPEVASMLLSSFDGGKLSLATFLISPHAWAQSLAFFAATWDEEQIEDEPELLAESLFAHIHGVLFASDDPDRLAALIHEALATDWGTTAFAVLFSTAIDEIIELANELHARGAHANGLTSSDHDIIPLAIAMAHTDHDGWERVMFELFPDWKPGDNELRRQDEDEEDDLVELGYEYAIPRSTQALLMRLRKQVPSLAATTSRPGMGEDIFA